LWVIFELLTAVAALLARFRADFTGQGVKIRTAEHEIRTGLTDLGAIQKKPNMIGLGVRPSFFQTVHDRLLADRMAIQALFDTRLQRTR
jgi:hypothetical protein